LIESAIELKETHAMRLYKSKARSGNDTGNALTSPADFLAMTKAPGPYNEKGRTPKNVVRPVSIPRGI
jgi:hypothetical protein